MTCCNKNIANITNIHVVSIMVLIKCSHKSLKKLYNYITWNLLILLKSYYSKLQL